MTGLHHYYSPCSNSIPTWEQQLMRRKPAILLDRDGVINTDKVGWVERWAEFQFCPGALEAILQTALPPKSVSDFGRK